MTSMGVELVGSKISSGSSETAGHAHAWGAATRCPSEHTRSVAKSVASREGTRSLQPDPTKAGKMIKSPACYADTLSKHLLTHMRDLM